MKIISAIIIILFTPFKQITQNTIYTQKNDIHYINLIKHTFYEKKLDETKGLPSFKSFFIKDNGKK